MGKIFYTLQEAAKVLKKTEAEVMSLISSGQLQEFRDRQQVMLKVDQVKLLTESPEDLDDILSEVFEDSSKKKKQVLNAFLDRLMSLKKDEQILLIQIVMGLTSGMGDAQSTAWRQRAEEVFIGEN
jgi:wyosine [tRNA(Phe)-imidazoG37] synthetase (radical SAM superfamily)